MALYDFRKYYYKEMIFSLFFLMKIAFPPHPFYSSSSYIAAYIFCFNIRPCPQIANDRELLASASAYNLTDCCVNIKLPQMCMPLCSFNANMTDIRSLAPFCGTELHKLIKCGAGGRNHGACCTRRGVPSNCTPLCNGIVPDSMLSVAVNCASFIGNVVQCFEEGEFNFCGKTTKITFCIAERRPHRWPRGLFSILNVPGNVLVFTNIYTIRSDSSATNISRNSRRPFIRFLVLNPLSRVMILTYKVFHVLVSS